MSSPAMEGTTIDERIRDRPRQTTEAPPGYRPLRRDGHGEVVEYEGPARHPGRRSAAPGLSTDPLLRPGAFGVRRRRLPVHGSFRSPRMRHAVAPSRSDRGGVRRTLGALA